MRRVDPYELKIKPFHLLDKEWALLVGGTAPPNLMTVSWGGFGTLWNLPVATIYVRPSRYTFLLLEREPEFSLNFMPAARRSALELCGTRSGRDLDKWEAAGLTKAPGEEITVPHVGDADLVLECRVVGTLDLDPGKFLNPEIEQLYSEKDYHRAYLGEVVGALASDRFLG